MNLACWTGKLKVLFCAVPIGDLHLIGMIKSYRSDRNRLLPRRQQPDRLVAGEQVEQMTQRLAARRGERRIARQDERRVIARGGEELAVHVELRDLEAWHAALPGAEHVALTAQLQVLLGDAEAVV